MSQVETVYHGTSLENALSILKEKTIKPISWRESHGYKGYSSFTKDFLNAELFGEVIFELQLDTSRFIKMSPALKNSNDKSFWTKWLRKNAEISAYFLDIRLPNMDAGALVDEPIYNPFKTLLTDKPVKFSFEDIELCIFSNDLKKSVSHMKTLMLHTESSVNIHHHLQLDYDRVFKDLANKD